jgi:tetratricopeptide (TPR) repeat protein
MADSKKNQSGTTAKRSPVDMLLVGVICLAAGLAIGYYFGRQVSEVSPVSGSGPSQSGAAQSPQSSIQDTAAFVQNEASLKVLVAANPKDMTTLVQLGNLYYDHARYEQAIEYYGKALDIDPKNADVRTDRGTSYWNLNQPDQALAEFEKSLQLNPGHAQTLYNMGVVYLNGKNDPVGARKAWQTLLDRNPSYPERAKVEQQIASLGSMAPGVKAPQPKPQQGSSSMEDLLQRMKAHNK